MARSTVPISQRNAGLISPYRPTASRNIPTTWEESKLPSHNIYQDMPHPRMRERVNTDPHPSAAYMQTSRLPSSTSGTYASFGQNAGLSHHGKLHKKNGSTSSTPKLKPDDAFNASADVETDLSSQLAVQTPDTFRPSPTPSYERQKPKSSIKPLLKKFAPQESNSLDLSRSVAENEGLGIYTSVDRERRATESNASPLDRRGPLHHRSTSGTSQFSTTTASSGHKPGSQYVHPMRQTPRPYTPPVSGSEHSGEMSRVVSELDNYPHVGIGERSTSSNSNHAPSSSLRLHTNSLSRFGTSSQTNLAGTPTSFRGMPDGMSVAETASPISRSSFDIGFRMRGRTSTDPASRNASIQAARRAFDEKEAAKARKYEEKELRAQDREAKRREKRSQSLETGSRPGLFTHRSSEAEGTDSIRGIDYGTLPRNEKAAHEPSSSKVEKKPRVKGTKSTWVLFLTWLRTRIFKLKRKVNAHD